MLILRDICKSFQKKEILHSISATFSPGEIVGLLGPNGAGKSTMMRIMTGYYLPDAGEVTIAGINLTGNSHLLKKIGYLPEVNPLYEDMGVDEFLLMTAQLKGCTLDLEKILSMTGLREKRMTLIQTLSKGYRQRVGLAAALVGDPDILILDEPTEGLDPGQRDDIKSLIRELGKKKTVIISSHVLGELTDLVSRVIIINEGTIKLDSTVEDLQSVQTSGYRIEVHFAGKADIHGLEEEFPDMKEMKYAHHVLVFSISEDRRHEILHSLMKRGKVVEFFSKKLDLSDVFFQTIQ